MGINFQKAEFVKSAAQAEGLVRTHLPIIAFSGKSNVGKSSVINRVLNHKNFARVGAKPGKTVHINYFTIDGKVMFADLPGYGFAVVAKSERDRWARLCESFFAEVPISLGVFIVDARHKPTADDVTMAAWYRETGCRTIVIANKVDKVKKSELSANLEIIDDSLAIPGAEILPFSAETGEGRARLVGLIEAVGKGE